MYIVCLYSYVYAHTFVFMCVHLLYMYVCTVYVYIDSSALLHWNLRPSSCPKHWHGPLTMARSSYRFFVPAKFLSPRFCLVFVIHDLCISCCLKIYVFPWRRCRIIRTESLGKNKLVLMSPRKIQNELTKTSLICYTKNVWKWRVQAGKKILSMPRKTCLGQRTAPVQPQM